MDEPQQRASSLRAIALASGVALAMVLPLAAATAGQDGPEPAHAPGGRPPAATASASPAVPAPGGPGGERAPGLPGPPPSELAPGGPSEVTAVCGRLSSAPRGVRAQTCVLARNGSAWGRMYYRNATGEPLHGALSLLGPGGRSVTVSCELPAQGGPGVCDTPRRRAARAPGGEGEDGGGAGAYTAVAEVGAPDGEGLLLRSGSETADGWGAGPRPR